MVRQLWKRWRFACLGLLGIALVIVTVRHVLEKRAQERRETAYQVTLNSYTDIFKPGMSRKDVEDYLHSKNIAFRQMCCVDWKSSSKHTYDDLVRIGQEDTPWFCSENNVYVAFQFTGQRAGNPDWPPTADDNLTAVTIFHWLEGCL